MPITLKKVKKYLRRLYVFTYILSISVLGCFLSIVSYEYNIRGGLTCDNWLIWSKKFIRGDLFLTPTEIQGLRKLSL